MDYLNYIKKPKKIANELLSCLENDIEEYHLNNDSYVTTFSFIDYVKNKEKGYGLLLQDIVSEEVEDAVVMVFAHMVENNAYKAAIRLNSELKDLINPDRAKVTIKLLNKINNISEENEKLDFDNDFFNKIIHQVYKEDLTSFLKNKNKTKFINYINNIIISNKEKNKKLKLKDIVAAAEDLHSFVDVFRGTSNEELGELSNDINGNVLVLNPELFKFYVVNAALLPNGLVLSDLSRLASTVKKETLKEKDFSVGLSVNDTPLFIQLLHHHGFKLSNENISRKNNRLDFNVTDIINNKNSDKTYSYIHSNQLINFKTDLDIILASKLQKLLVLLSKKPVNDRVALLIYQSYDDLKEIGGKDFAVSVVGSVKIEGNFSVLTKKVLQNLLSDNLEDFSRLIDINGEYSCSDIRDQILFLDTLRKENILTEKEKNLLFDSIFKNIIKDIDIVLETKDIKEGFVYCSRVYLGQAIIGEFANNNQYFKDINVHKLIEALERVAKLHFSSHFSSQDKSLENLLGMKSVAGSFFNDNLVDNLQKVRVSRRTVFKYLERKSPADMISFVENLLSKKEIIEEYIVNKKIKETVDLFLNHIMDLSDNMAVSQANAICTKFEENLLYEQTKNIKPKNSKENRSGLKL